MSYNLIEGSNGALILEVAVPGLQKDELTVKLQDGNLIVDTTDTKEYRFLRRGIDMGFPMSFNISNSGYSVKYVSLANGLLSILLSKDTELEMNFVIN